MMSQRLIAGFVSGFCFRFLRVVTTIGKSLMGRKKKSAKNLTTEEAMQRLFPAKVVREVKKVAHEKDNNDRRKSAEKK